MKTRFFRYVSRLLIVTMAALPFTAQAGMIGTGEILAQQATPERAKVTGFLARADVLEQLQQHGVTREAAMDRVAALTDSEVSLLATEIDKLPAGATTGGAAVIGLTVLAVLLVALLVRIFYPHK
jgi:hypothetical protein